MAQDVRVGGTGLIHRSTPKLNAQVQPRNDSTGYREAQGPRPGSRLQRIYAQAAVIARSEALRDSKRALLAIEPDEVAEFRRSSAMLMGIARSLVAEAAR